MDSNKLSLTIGWVLVGVSLLLGILFLVIGIWLARRKKTNEATATSEQKGVSTGAIVLIALGTLFLGMTMAATILNLTYNKKIADFLADKTVQLHLKSKQAAKQATSNIGQGMITGGQRMMNYAKM